MSGDSGHPGAPPGLIESMYARYPAPGLGPPNDLLYARPSDFLDTQSTERTRDERAEKVVEHLEFLKKGYEWALESFAEGKGHYYADYIKPDGKRWVVTGTPEQIQETIQEDSGTIVESLTEEEVIRKLGLVKHTLHEYGED